MDRLEITLGRRRGGVAFVQAAAYAGEQLATECELVLGVVADGTSIHPSANVHPSATIGAGTSIGPHATVGPHVVLGAGCRIGASSVIEGWTQIGDGTEVYPFASIGLSPQDHRPDSVGLRGDPLPIQRALFSTHFAFLSP